MLKEQGLGTSAGYNQSMQPAIFLDRDGVIIENRPQYVRSWGDVEIYPQALSALARLRNSPYKIVIVTNQSGIGRGLIPPEVAEAINQRLIAEIEKAGGRVDAVFMCPHAPDDHCDCRKPLPGLIQNAARQLQIDLSQSVMIGDALSDIQAGKAAGIVRLALVRTGRGAQQEALPEIGKLGEFSAYPDLEDALAAIFPQG